MGRLILIISMVLLFQTIGFGQVKLKDPLSKEGRTGLCWNGRIGIIKSGVLARNVFYNDADWLNTFTSILSEKTESKGLVLIFSKSKKSFHYLNLIPLILKHLDNEGFIETNRISVAFIQTDAEIAFLNVLPKEKDIPEFLQSSKYEILSKQEISKLTATKSNKIHNSKIKN